MTGDCASLGRNTGGPGENDATVTSVERATRRIEWGRPGSDYRGSGVVAEGTTNTAGGTIHLHTRDDADAEEVTQIFDQAVANIRRLLSRR